MPRHVLSVTRLAGTSNAVTTTFTYEPVFNQLATVTDPLNHAWTTTYDSSGLLTGMVDPLTHRTQIAMTPAGLVTRVTDPLQHAWQFGYTGGDLTSVTDPLNFTTTRFVDAGGRVLTVTDPIGHVTGAVSDKLNRITSLTDALGGQTAFAYDGNSNVRSLTDALMHATGYAYDTSDRVASRTDPLQKSASYLYDGNNNLTQGTDRKGQVTSYQYDALDRLTLVTYADGSTTQYTYDAGDRVTQVADSVGGTILRSYDLLDRLTGETTLQGAITYGYDAAGRRTSMLVAGQPTVNYTYDNANRLTAITQGATSVGFTYDDADRRSTVTLPNGIVGTYGWDAASQLTTLSYTLGGTTLGNLTYTYDAAGNRTTVVGSWARTGLPQAMAGATYDAANRITTWNGQAFSYDANGNLGSDGATSYLWNARNQLSGMSGGASASFVYDGVSRRQAKTVNGSTINFLYDGVNNVQELVGGTPTANLVAGRIDENFLRTDVAGSWSFLPDALGSTLALTDASGALSTQYAYDPFGVTAVSGPGGNNSAQYAARENDLTGLYYYRARYYALATLRFLSEDPRGFASGDADLYAFVFDNPTNWVDPSGLDATVTYWPADAARFGHVGIGVNTDQTSGFYPTKHPACLVLGCDVKGEVLNDPAHHPGVTPKTVVIPTTPQQDVQMQQVIDRRLKNPGPYNLWSRNCARFVEDVLSAAGVPAPSTRYPKEVFDQLTSQQQARKKR